jgi:acyl-CoA thioester hydrolase
MKPAEEIAAGDVAFTLPVRVYYQDTDAGGVVYHSRYLDFMERSRYEWLRSLGYGSRQFVTQLNALFVVRSITIQYLKPALLDDLLQVTVRVLELGRSRALVEQQVLRGEERMVEARVEAVCVNAESLKPVSIPAQIRDGFKN